MPLSLWEKLPEKYRVCTQAKWQLRHAVYFPQEISYHSYFTFSERGAPLTAPAVVSSLMPGVAYHSKILPGCIPHSGQRYSFLCLTQQKVFMNQLEISVHIQMTHFPQLNNSPQLQMPNRKGTSVKNKPLKLEE